MANEARARKLTEVAMGFLRNKGFYAVQAYSTELEKLIEQKLAEMDETEFQQNAGRSGEEAGISY